MEFILNILSSMMDEKQQKTSYTSIQKFVQFQLIFKYCRPHESWQTSFVHLFQVILTQEISNA